MTKKNDILNLTNQKFGKLTVIKKSEQKGNNGKAKWDCVCDCGNLYTTLGDLLRSGKTKSCGCLKFNFQPPNKKTDRDEHLKERLYKNLIIKRSRHMQKEYDVSYIDFCNIIEQPCFYCGDKNTNYIQDYSSKGGFISDAVLFYNGVDRVNSDLGYLNSNVVSCCKKCNMAKNNMPISEFKIWLNKIYLNFIITEKEPYCDVGKMRVEGL